MNSFKSAKYQGRAHMNEMFDFLGVKGAKWPDAGLPMQEVQGIVVWVNPKPVKLNKHGVQVKSSTHRVRCLCPTCGAEMSAGRLFQHKCKVN